MEIGGFELSTKLWSIHWKQYNAALYCQPRTSSHPPQHKAAAHSNQVSAMNITCDVFMHKGWMYLCTVVDWYSRTVLCLAPF